MNLIKKFHRVVTLPVLEATRPFFQGFRDGFRETCGEKVRAAFDEAYARNYEKGLAWRQKILQKK
jgi:hypothetical protein